MTIGVYSTKDDGMYHIQEYREINAGEILETLEITVMAEQVVMHSNGTVEYDARLHYAGELAQQ